MITRTMCMQQYKEYGHPDAKGVRYCLISHVAFERLTCHRDGPDIDSLSLKQYYCEESFQVERKNALWFV